MKIDTTTLLLIGAAVVGVYLLTRPSVPAAYSPYGVPNPYLTNPYGAQSALSLASGNYAGNQTAQDISAGSQAVSSISSLLGNFF
jgi:hypothetical protein